MRIGGVLLLIGVLAAPSVVAQSDGYAMSPDGVQLTDFYETSEVWGRGFKVELPEGLTKLDVINRCQEKAQGRIPPASECLRPFMKDLHWIDGDGQRIGQRQNGGEENLDVCQRFINSITVKTHGYRIYDEIDPGSSNAEPFYKVMYEDCNGTTKTTAKQWCQDQGYTIGNCNKDIFIRDAAFDADCVAHPCKSHVTIEFVDEDPFNPDDTLDISFKNERATAPIEVRTNSVDTASKWYGDWDISAPPALCHSQDENDFCIQNGNADGGTGNYDAHLDISIDDAST